MAVNARREKEKQQRSEDIVAAAEKVFFEKGFANSSMDEIATKAQLSRALLYVYFKDKAAIMRAVMLNAVLALEQTFQEALQAGDTGLDQISGIGRAYYRYSIDQSDYFDVMTELNTFPFSAEDTEVAANMSACRLRITELMITALENGIKDGSLSSKRIPNTSLTAHMLQGALHGVIMSTREQREAGFAYPDSEALVHYSIDMMSEAMRG